jgi:hypothetical protein
VALKNLPTHDKFRRFVCFELIKADSKMTIGEISQHPDKPPSSKTGFRWQKRKDTPTDDSLYDFRGVAPIALDFFDCAPFGLLADSPLSLEEIDELISVYRHDSDELPYRFPVDLPVTDIWCWDEPCRRDDSASLAKRGDIYGLFAILALVREAEAKNDFQNHIFHLRNLCQSLPLLGRFEWARRDYSLLFDSVLCLRNRVDNTKSRLGIYWYRITDYFLDPTDRPNALFDAIDPGTLLPAGLPNMTYLATAIDIGEPPVWPDNKDPLGAGFSSVSAKDLPYSVASEICADKILLTAIANVAGIWELSGHVRAACIGVSAGDLSSLFSDGDRFLTDRHKTRIAITLALLNKLGDEASVMDDCGYILRRPRDELGGESVLSSLGRGQLFEVADALGVQEFRELKEREFCTVVIENIRASVG